MWDTENCLALISRTPEFILNIAPTEIQMHLLVYLSSTLKKKARVQGFGA